MWPLVIQIAVVLCVAGLAVKVRGLRRQRNALREEKQVVMEFMHDIAEVFTQSHEDDVGQLLKRLLFYAQRTSGASAGAVYLLDRERGRLHVHATIGVFPPIVGGIDGELDPNQGQVRQVERMVRMQEAVVGQGLVGEVASTGHPILIPRAEMDNRVPVFAPDFLAVESVLLISMSYHREVIGVLAMVNRVDGEPFNDSDRTLLQSLSDQATVSVHHAQSSAALEAATQLQHDLATASEIQRALLPKWVPTMEGVEVDAFCESSQKVGGDYYDFIEIDDEHLGIVVADVSGKGVAAGLVIAMCRSVLRNEAQGELNPVEALRNVNATLFDDIAEDMFISILYMVLRHADGEVRIARAGHAAPIVRRADNGHAETIKSRGMAIGMAEPDVFDALLEEKKFQLCPGDTLVAYTDGITEAMNLECEEWGLPSLIESIETADISGSGGIVAVTHAVRKKLVDFTRYQPQYDDMTLVAVKICD